MTVEFRTIDESIEAWEAHRLAFSAFGGDVTQLAQVESYMIRTIVMIVVSEYEQLIEKMLIKRGARSSDSEIHNYFRGHFDKAFRSPDLGTINKHLKMFSESCRNAFSEKVEGSNPQFKAAWDNLLTARHAIVHKKNSGNVNLTWDDLKDCYSKTKSVIAELASALGLSLADMSSL